MQEAAASFVSTVAASELGAIFDVHVPENVDHSRDQNSLVRHFT